MQLYDYVPGCAEHINQFDFWLRDITEARHVDFLSYKDNSFTEILLTGWS